MFLGLLQDTDGRLIDRRCRHAGRRRGVGKRATAKGIRWAKRDRNLDRRWRRGKSRMKLVSGSYGRSVWKLWRALLGCSVCAIESYLRRGSSNDRGALGSLWLPGSLSLGKLGVSIFGHDRMNDGLCVEQFNAPARAFA